jgi:hypothetical protein
MGAAFPAPIAKIREVLPSKHLKPVQSVPGFSAVVLIATENRVVESMNPYNELDIMIPVTYETGDNKIELPGSYCLSIPVTTEEARFIGAEIYGFPKLLADVSFEETSKKRSCKVSSAGKDILTFEVKRADTESELYDTYTYTVKDDQIVRTLLQVQGKNSTNYVKGGASFTLGDHPIADELRALHINTTSAMHRYAPQLRMLIHLPTERFPL